MTIRPAGRAALAAVAALALTAGCSQPSAPAGDAPAKAAAPVQAGAMTFTTLGTNSGPIPSPERSEPANLLRFGDQVVLVDVGDGAPEQLAKVGVPLKAVTAVVISHLHFDHTGGLFALLGLRYQAGIQGPLTIYGPPGTKKTVADLLIAARPGMEVAGTIRGKPTEADRQITVVELTDGAVFQMGAIQARAVTNSHYVTLKPNPSGHTALSFRFEAGGRSILYTGDTGPSDKVEALCQGADLLVSEIMDPKESIARIRKARPDVPAIAWPIVEDHFRREHLSPKEVGLLANRCQAKALVLTHNALGRENLPAATAVIAKEYAGPITWAEDLKTF